MLTFEEYKAQRDQLSNWHREIGRELSAYPKNEMGMMIESIRNTPQYTGIQSETCFVQQSFPTASHP